MGWLTSAGEATAVVNPVIGGVMTLAGKVLDNLYPDPVERAKAQQALDAIRDGKEARELNAMLQAQMGQIEIDKVEAGSENSFKSCWRPFLGWICGISLAYSWLLQPLLVWMSVNAGWKPPLTLSVAEQMTIVGQMMGLATARTVEKIKGSA
jgi:hypothetical protein